jgi:hypothetical protein
MGKPRTDAEHQEVLDDLEHELRADQIELEHPLVPAIKVACAEDWTWQE